MKAYSYMYVVLKLSNHFQKYKKDCLSFNFFLYIKFEV